MVPFALCGQLGKQDQGVPGTSSKSHDSAVSNKSSDYCGLTPTLQNLGIPGKMPGKDVSSVYIALGTPWGCTEELAGVKETAIAKTHKSWRH